MAFAIPLALAAAGTGGAAAAAGGSLATIASVASIAGAGVSAFSSISQGVAASRAAAYNAQVADNNAKIATQNAQYAGAEGEQNAAASEMNTRAKVGAIAAAQGANGIDVNTGSAVNVRASASELGELDAMNIRANAARQAYGYETQSGAFSSQSALDKSQSKSDETGGLISGGATFLGGVGNAALNFSKFQQSSGNVLNTSDIPSVSQGIAAENYPGEFGP